MRGVGGRLHLEREQLDVGVVRGVLLQPRRQSCLQLRQRLIGVRRSSMSMRAERVRACVLVLVLVLCRLLAAAANRGLGVSREGDGLREAQHLRGAV